jgi:hypothetical protein
LKRTTRSIHGRTAFLLLAGAALLAARPAAADWLVTQEGARVETHGPWQVKGKLVVFTTPDGTLASLRLAQVDLPASQRATAERQKMVEEDIARPSEKKKPVRSITDKDVAHPGAPATGDPAATGKPDEAKTKDGKDGKSSTVVNKGKSSAVVVGSWQKADRNEKDGIELFGEIKNEAAEIASQVGMTITLLDETGKSVGTAEAVLTSDTIEPRGATNFRAVFSGVFTFASARFDVRSAPIKLQAVEAPGDKPKSPSS